MGDPETEVVIPRIKSDLVELLMGVGNQQLNQQTLEIESQSASTVMLVSGGYPESYEKGKVIHGLEDVTDSLLFHAGAQQQGSEVLTSGGRVLAVTSFGKTFEEAIKKSYQSIEKLRFDKMYYRKDIGFDL
jgi:phosphoribosylamine--glycine ligase